MQLNNPLLSSQPPTSAQPPQDDQENVPPETSKKRSSHKRGAKFWGIGRSPQYLEMKRKLEAAELEAAAEVKPRTKVRKLTSYDMERPLHLYFKPATDAPGHQRNPIDVDAMSSPSPPPIQRSKPALRFEFPVLSPLPPLPPKLPVLPPLPPLPPLPRLPTPAELRQQEYEYGPRPPVLRPRLKSKTASNKLYIRGITNPFLPTYGKVNGKRVQILSDSDDVEDPNSTRNRKRRRYFRAVILQQGLLHRLMPVVQTELMQRPMKAVVQELTAINTRREYIRDYVLPLVRGRPLRPVLDQLLMVPITACREYMRNYVVPRIRGRPLRPVLAQLLLVRPRFPHRWQTPTEEGPSTFWFLLYSSFPEWERHRFDAPSFDAPS